MFGTSADGIDASVFSINVRVVMSCSIGEVESSTARLTRLRSSVWMYPFCSRLATTSAATENTGGQ
jgi:hypothetical protein